MPQGSISYFSCVSVAIIPFISDDFRCFRRPAPKKSVHDGINLGVRLLGEILEIASFMATPLGLVLTLAGGAAAFFYGRWVLSN
jgi:hypothetical protein